MSFSGPRERASPPYRHALLLALGYAVLDYLGSWLYIGNTHVDYFWPANALVVAVLVASPLQHWRWFLAVAGMAEVCVDLSLNMPWPVSVGFAAADIIECALAAWLARRFGGRVLELQSLRSVFCLVAMAAIASAASAWVGGAVLLFARFEESYVSGWLGWWLGEAIGLLLMTPAFAALGRARIATLTSLPPLRHLEMVALIAGMSCAVLAAFGVFGQTLALRSLVFPFLVWTALRFGVGAVTWSLVAVAGVALWEVISSNHALAAADSDVAAQAVIVQAFLVIASVTTLSLAAALAEKRAATRRFRRVVEAAPNGIVMVDGDGRITLANAQAQRLFGYSRAELLGQHIAALVSHGEIDSPSGQAWSLAGILHRSEDLPIDAGRDLYAKRKDGSRLAVEIGLNRIDTAEGPMVLAALVDISERKQNEQRLRAAYEEKEVLLKEVYHRVKNNLQIVSALISLQAKNMHEDAARQALARGQARIQSIALVHEQLYQSANLATLDVANYVTTLATHLRSQFREAARIRVECAAIALGMDQAIACGLIITELVTNAIRHAFVDGRHGEVVVRLQHGEDAWLTLEVSDNGVGLPEGVELAQQDSFGWVLVQSLAQQLGASISVRRERGTAVQVRFRESRKTVEAAA
jgi:PAS domain S-box-containing protein